MVVVATNRDDLTADWLILDLLSRDAAFARFNTDDYPHSLGLRWTPSGDAFLPLPDEHVNLARVTSV